MVSGNVSLAEFLKLSMTDDKECGRSHQTASTLGESSSEDQHQAKTKFRMFGRNTVASAFTFTLDFGILWLLVEWGGLPQFLAAAIAFIPAMVVFYFIQKRWVFAGNDREKWKGFGYFSLNVAIGYVSMLAIFWLMLEFVQVHYLISRLIASVVYGLLLFFLNGKFNFKKL